MTASKSTVTSPTELTGQFCSHFTLYIDKLLQCYIQIGHALLGGLILCS